MNTREWIHNETPEGKPSAAAARLGCKCPACREALREYLRAYRASRVAQVENFDGTAMYHTHKGQPSKRTARKFDCVHPRCLSLAGLRLIDGAVCDAVTGIVDARWGLPGHGVAA